LLLEPARLHGGKRRRQQQWRPPRYPTDRSPQASKACSFYCRQLLQIENIDLTAAYNGDQDSKERSSDTLDNHSH
jgi:hypothetical protein